MRHFLAAVAAGVDDGSEAVRAAFLLGKLRHEVDHFTQECGIFGFGRSQGLDVLLGNNQKMHGRLGVDVAEGEHVVVFIDLAAADFAARNLAENTIIELHDA